MSYTSKLIKMAKMVAQDHANREGMGICERIAVALVFNRLDWLMESGYRDRQTAMERIGSSWSFAVQAVAMTGW